MHALGTTGTSVGLCAESERFVLEQVATAPSWGGNPGDEMQVVTAISERVYPLRSCFLRVATVE